MPRAARQLDHGTPRDAVEEAIGRRRVQLAVDHQEQIGAGALGEIAAVVQHQRVVVALASASCLLSVQIMYRPAALLWTGAVFGAGR